MSNSLRKSPNSLREEKPPDPFAIADLDSLADEILTETEQAEVNIEKLRALAQKMKATADIVTRFILGIGEVEIPEPVPVEGDLSPERRAGCDG